MTLQLPLLIEPEMLQSNLDHPDLLVVDLCRPQQYASAHIPGAVYLPFSQLMGGMAPAPGALPELPGLDDDDVILCSSPALSLPYGVGKAGTFGVPALGSSAPPVLGQVSGIKMTQALPGAQPILFLGFQRLDVAFDGGRLLVDPAMVQFVPTAVAPDGSLTLQGLLPANPGLCGVSVFYQLMFIDAGAAGSLQLAMTNGLNHIFGW